MQDLMSVFHRLVCVCLVLTISLICESVICRVTLRALSVSSTGRKALE